LPTDDDGRSIESGALDSKEDLERVLDHAVEVYLKMMADDDPTNTREATTMTDTDIRKLRAEAAGDLEQVTICDRALKGDQASIEECREVIDVAKAMLDDPTREAT